MHGEAPVILLGRSFPSGQRTGPLTRTLTRHEGGGVANVMGGVAFVARAILFSKEAPAT